MQPLPLLLRQPFRWGLKLTRAPNTIRTPFLPAVGSKALLSKELQRSFSVCLQCQFRTQNANLRSDETSKLSADRTDRKLKNGETVIALPGGTDTNAGSDRETTHHTEQERNAKANRDGAETGGLPSYIENHRSQLSKQFTSMMDNLQSNVFVAGQRLNDLTGYSSIEALKKAIHDQEDRLRVARLQVRTTKDVYAAAINRRSASQREVNELLQRKHTWSPADLERFTHLYRNDHTNEVAENEAQEALAAAEREAEEAAAQLTRNILSRYHEEQVWSDKIRRMSTWGTWGLMGVNVLLFLIFQIGVEPWRRKRLVKGFEEKVIEAIEKEKAINQAQLLAAVGSVPAATEETTTSPTSKDTLLSTERPTVNSSPDSLVDVTVSTLTESGSLATEDASTSTIASYKPPPLQFPPSHTTVESWRQYLEDMFSDRSIIVAKRDIFTIAVTSAAAGAAVMGLVLTLIRPR